MKTQKLFQSELIKSATLKSYATAVISVTVALAANLLLSRWIEPRTTPLFLAAVAVAAWRGGKYPSLLATALAVFAIDFFFEPPVYVFDFSLNNAINAIVFVGVALLISWIDGERRQSDRDRVALLESERRARFAAEGASREKDEFLAMVTHDLRSPLNAMLGWTQILKKDTLDAGKRRHALTVIERSTRSQARLIEDLLDVSRIKTGKFSIETMPIDLRPVIEEAIESVASSAAAKRIRLRRELSEKIGLINGDNERLRQVVWNLLSNAVKFTPENGEIEIRLDSCGNRAHLTICDTGAGISPDFLPFVFDSYRQSQDGGKAKHKGLGLGLAIVRHFVQAHGGTVGAASAGIGLGATFTIELPLLSAAFVAEKNAGENGSLLESPKNQIFSPNFEIQTTV